MGKPLITYQTGEEESFLIGTKEQLIKFAEQILESVNNANTDNFFGEKVMTSRTLSRVLDGKGSLQIDELVITDNDEQKSEIFYKIINS
ncbi:MAG: hypothetical protein ACRBB3_09070 [Alphaproteobacteria bacterium]